MSDKANVLVIDDDPRTRELVETSLTRAGYGVMLASDGASGMQMAKDNDAALVLLDLSLPDADGLDLLDEIRAGGDTPIIIMTNRASEGDRVMGLESGADDYVVKPFSTRELAARIDAVLRRSGGSRADRLVFGDLEIDIGAREAKVGGDVAELTRKEFDVLALLAADPRRAFSRDELLRAVWDSAPEFQDDATVTEHVRRLRQKLGPAGDRISTVRGVGYRFDA